MKYNLKHLLLAAGAFTGIIVSCSTPVLAQETPPVDDGQGSTVISDVIVTARKRSESLITVPVAVTAISADTIERANATNLEKIGDLAPQVSLVKGFSGSGASFTIRGLGSSFIDAGVEQTVAVNIDGIPVGRGHIVAQSFFDISQVEIMKGPQALFFGKNSPAGVVSVTSRGPGAEREGYVRAGYEFVADERYIEGAVGGPITDTFGIRLAGRASKMQGYLVNTAKAAPYLYAPSLMTQGPSHVRQPRTSSYQGRLTAVWTPTDNFTAEFKASGANYKDDGSDAYAQVICFAPLTKPFYPPVGMSDTNANCALDKIRTSSGAPTAITSTIKGIKSDGKNRSDLDVILTSMNLHYRADNISVSSTTGYYYIDAVQSFSADRSSFALIPAVVFERNNTFTQEVRVASDFETPLNFTVGAFFESTNNTTGARALVIPAGPDPVTGTWASMENETGQRARTYSAFAQLRWSIQDTLELAGGLRYTHLKKTSETSNIFVNRALGPAAAFFLPQGVVLRPHNLDRNTSPEVTLTWRPSDDLTLYGAFKTGYKSGGASSPILVTPSATSQNLSFKPETAIGGEVGFKGYAFARQVRFDLTVYSYKYKNLQVISYDQPSISLLIQNAASARVEGVEGAVEWRATPELTLNAAVGYNRARYLSFPTASCGTRTDAGCVPNGSHSLAGSPLVRAPDWSGNAGFVYDMPLGSRLRLGLNADVQFSSKYYTQEDINPLAKQDAYAKLNAGLRVYDAHDRWELALIGRNLTNEYILLFSNDMALGGGNQFVGGSARPREITLQGTVRF